MKKSNRTTIGVIAAVLLALVGGLLLWQSKGTSESDATQPAAESVPVLVAVNPIDRGAAASELEANAYAYVEVTQVPQDQVRPQALTSVEDLADLALAGNVVVTPIAAGSQLSITDFIVAGEQNTSALADVPENLFQITVALEPQRALGGFVRAGQTVGVVGSFDPGDDEPMETVLIVDDVLVTNVQAEQLLTEQQTSLDPLAPTLAPNARLLVTFGVEIEDLERLTYAVEFGRIWLADQGDEATIGDTAVRAREDVVVALDENGRPTRQDDAVNTSAE